MGDHEDPQGDLEKSLELAKGSEPKSVYRPRTRSREFVGTVTSFIRDVRAQLLQYGHKVYNAYKKKED